MAVFLQDKERFVVRPFEDIYGNYTFFKSKDETLLVPISIAEIQETSIDSITYEADGGATITEYEVVGDAIFFKVDGTDGTIIVTILMEAVSGSPFDDVARSYRVKFRFVRPE